MLNNWNDSHTGPRQAAEKLAHSKIEFGRVINVTRDSILTGTYDVELFAMGGVIARGCTQSTDTPGFDGSGRLRPLIEGTPVVVAFKSGRISEGVILNGFFTLGNVDEYVDGKILKPGEIPPSAYPGAPANQRPLHPSVVAQPQAFVDIIPGVPPDEPYNDPAYQLNPDDPSARRGMVAMDLTSEQGDRIRYTSGVNIDYSDRSRVEVVVTDNTDCAVRLVQSARRYVQMASLWAGVPVDGLQTMTDITPAIEKIMKEIVPDSESTRPPSPLPIKGIELPLPDGLEIPQGMSVQSFSIPEAKVLRKSSALPDSLRVKKELELATEHIKLAKTCVSMIGSLAQNVNNLVQQFGSTNGQAVVPTDGLTVPQKYETPNSSPRRSKPDLVVLHETVGNLASAISFIQNPAEKISYHAIVDRNGGVHRFVSDDRAAWASGGSVFTNAQGNREENINDRSWNFSFESPPMRNQNDLSQHSGYTDAQYRTMARLVHETGVPAERITTHAAINPRDRSDPRKFDFARFNRYLNELRGSPQVLREGQFPGRL